MRWLPVRVIVVATAAALSPLAAVALAHLLFGVSIPDLTRDVAAIANIPPHFGILSSFGIVLWWTSAVLWLFSAFLVHALERGNVAFYVYSGVLSAYLGFDDYFQFHELIGPRYLGLSELATFSLLAAATAYYVWRFWDTLLRPDSVLLVVALGLLAGSVVLDAILAPWMWHFGEWEYLVEDGLKWMGIVCWTAFCTVRCASELSSARAPQPRTSGDVQPMHAGPRVRASVQRSRVHADDVGVM